MTAVTKKERKQLVTQVSRIIAAGAKPVNYSVGCLGCRRMVATSVVDYLIRKLRQDTNEWRKNGKK